MQYNHKKSALQWGNHIIDSAVPNVCLEGSTAFPRQVELMILVPPLESIALHRKKLSWKMQQAIISPFESPIPNCNWASAILTIWLNSLVGLPLHSQWLAFLQTWWWVCRYLAIPLVAILSIIIGKSLVCFIACLHSCKMSNLLHGPNS